MPKAERRNVRRWAALGLAVLAALTSAAMPAPGAAAGPPPPPQWAAWDVGPGVQHLLTIRPALVAHAARIEAGAPVALRPVVAHGRIGGPARQPTTDLCARVGGIVCVNADFFACPTCGQVAGGVVQGGRTLRSPRRGYPQISLKGDQLTTEPLWWSGRLHGHVGDEEFDLPLASLNRGPQRGGAALFSAEWGPATPGQVGQLDLVFAAGGPLHPGQTHVAPVAIRPKAGGIPRDGVVISGNGAGAEVLDRLWAAWRAQPGGDRELVLDTALSFPAKLSVGGHPILLQDGQRRALDQRDSLVRNRHPRTIVGWTETGDLLLVAIDGRRPGYSNGMTLRGATDLLVELGAVDAVNLDGGGSTTFALRCPRGACVANRPSDGRERPVPLALAVVPTR